MWWKLLMILIVKFFKHAISIKFHFPLELLYLAIGIMFIGLALYLSHAADSAHSHTSKKEEAFA